MSAVTPYVLHPPSLKQLREWARRYHLRSGSDYLHWSCMHLTTDRGQAWSGTFEQARACKKRFDAAAGCTVRSIQPVAAHRDQPQ